MSRYSIAYFTDDELKCHKTGGLVLDPLFDLKLTELRIAFGEPMIVNSCCRSKEYNKEVGGAPKSFHIYDEPAWSHLEGCSAIDIKYDKLFYRNKLARCAWKLGWRIGFNQHFLHLDIGAMKGLVPQHIFKYDNVTDDELEKFKQVVNGS